MKKCRKINIVAETQSMMVKNKQKERRRKVTPKRSIYIREKTALV